MDDLDARIDRLSPERRELLLRLTKFGAVPDHRTGTSLENTLCEIWSDLFGTSVGVDDNYFELGGDSLLSSLVIARAKAAGISLTSELLFEKPTIAELALSLTPSCLEVAPAPANLPRQEYPLTPLQSGILFHTLETSNSGTYVSQFCCRLNRPLDAERFRKAWDHVIARHEILRAGIVATDVGSPVQRIHASVTVPITYLDWRGTAEEERTAALRRFLASDRLAGFNLASPPLMRLTLIQEDTDRHRCVWTHHHIILDGWSQLVILGDFLNFYGGAAPVNAAGTFDAYARWLGSQDLAEAETFWREYLADAPIHEAAAPAVEPCVEETVVFDAQETSACEQLARSAQVTPAIVLLAAHALMLGCEAGQEDVVFGVTTSLRPPEIPGVEELAGLCINTLPMRIQIGGRTVGDCLRALQLQYRKWHGFSYTPLADIGRFVPSKSGLFDSLLVIENFPLALWPQRLATGPLRITDVHFEVKENYQLVVVATTGPPLMLQIKTQRGERTGEVARRLGMLFRLALAELSRGEATSMDTIRCRLESEWRAVDFATLKRSRRTATRGRHAS